MKASVGYGVIGRFEHPDALLEAVKSLRDSGCDDLEVFTPYPVEGLASALGEKSRWLPVAALVGALTAAALFYTLVWYSAVIDYPYVVGGKPLHSWPPFLLLAFVLAILAASLIALCGLLLGCRLPRLYHPAFNLAQFARASQDSFFVLVRVDGDAANNVATVSRQFTQLDALDIEEVPT